LTPLVGVMADAGRCRIWALTWAHTPEGVMPHTG
jgi:hypothetical protein